MKSSSHAFSFKMPIGSLELVVEVVVTAFAECQKSEKPRKTRAKRVDQLSDNLGVDCCSCLSTASCPRRISLSRRRSEIVRDFSARSSMRAAARMVGWWSSMWLTSIAVGTPQHISRWNVRHSPSETVLAVRMRSGLVVGKKSMRG